MTPALVALLALGVAAGVGLVALDGLIRRPLAGTALVLGASLVATAVGEAPGLDLVGFRFTTIDVVVVALLVAVVARLLRGARLGGPGAAVAALGGLVVLSIARGAGEFGLAAAVNEARGPVAFVVAVLYCATSEATVRRRERTAGLWLGLACALVALAVLRWVIVLGGLPFTGEWYRPDEYAGLRVLWSDEALLLAQSTLILAPLLLRTRVARRADRRRLRLAAVIGGSVLVLQHRSVWAVTLVGVALTLSGEGAVGRRWAGRLVAGAGLAAVLLLTTLSGPAQERVLSSSDAVSADTFRWRLEGWQVLIAQQGPESLSEALIGRPYGSGWARRLSLGYTTDVAPHNFYLETGLRTGLLGVGLLLGAYVALLRRLSAARGGGVLADRTLAVLLVTQLVYFLPYSPGAEQAVLLGLAIAAARQAGAATEAYTRSRASRATAGV